MRQATAFLFPSMLESCPLTLLEAMACGAPIAASDVPPMPELCGNAAVYFNPRDSRSVASALADILAGAGLRARLIRAGYARAAEFTWERTVRGLIEMFCRVGQAALIRN